MTRLIRFTVPLGEALDLALRLRCKAKDGKARAQEVRDILLAALSSELEEARAVITRRVRKA